MGLNSKGDLSWPKPDFAELVSTHKRYQSAYRAALMYAHYELSSGDLKKEVIRYFRSIDPKHKFLNQLREIDETQFSTVGKYLYIVNNKGEIPTEILQKILTTIEEIIRADSETQTKVVKKETIEPETKNENKLNIQDRIREKALSVAGEIEGWIDEFIVSKTARTIEDYVGLFKAQDLKAPHMKYLYECFEPRATVISDIIEKNDKELLEGYSNFTRPELKKLNTMYVNILSACGMMKEVSKVARTPRKKKAISNDKIVARLKFKKEDTALGIVSQNPTQLVGSKEVWIYNTKTRKLSQYKAKDADGISVKGASLINFSADSIEKTLRQPAPMLTDFKAATKVKLRTFLKDLSTLDTKCTGKLNEHCVILRIDK